MEQSLDEHAAFLEHLLNSITVALYGVVIIIFIVVLLLISPARSRFHPLFCMLFFLLVAGYIICDTLLVISTLLSMLNYQDSRLGVVIGVLYQAAYIYLTCLVAFCVLERLSATVLSKTYEFQKNWLVLLVGQTLSNALIWFVYFTSALSQLVQGLIICVHIYVNRLGGTISGIVQLVLSCVILVSVSILLAINWHLHASTRGERSLSFRYQISENVKLLRLITPVVLLDTAVTTTDVVGSILFYINPEFEGYKYKSEYSYFLAYVVLRAIAIVLEYCIPIVIVTSKALRRDVCRTLSKVVGVPPSAQNEVEDAWVAREDPQKIYLNYLRNQWAK